MNTRAICFGHRIRANIRDCLLVDLDMERPNLVYKIYSR